MKRFLLFVYPDYYPAGGTGDLVGDYDSITAAKAALEENRSDNYDLLDIKTGETLTIERHQIGNTKEVSQ